MSWLVLLEWDGDKPPTKFYDRMRRLGLYVQGGDKGESPISRRASLNLRATRGEPSVIFQEGAIICASESTARLVYMEAVECGVKAAELFSANPIKWSMTTEDAKVLQRIEGTFGRRGRPTADMIKQSWVCTCFEEANTYVVDEQVSVVNCPECSGTSIHARPGDPIKLSFPVEKDIVKAWARHRFASGRFEIPDSAPGSPEPPALSVPDDDRESATLDKILANSDLSKILGKIKRETAVAILDAIFCARTYVSRKTRQERRVSAVVYLYEKGVKPSEIGLLESQDVEFIDAAGVSSKIMSPEKVAAIYLAARRQ